MCVGKHASRYMDVCAGNTHPEKHITDQKFSLGFHASVKSKINMHMERDPRGHPVTAY